VVGGGAIDEGKGIAVDSSGNAYVTGIAGSADFPTTVGAWDTTLNGGSDAFVTKLNPAGAALVYSTYLGGALQEAFRLSIAVDSAGNAYVTGDTYSADFPTTVGAFDETDNGGADAFVTKLNPTGSAPLVYSTYLGGASGEEGLGIDVDSAGNAYVTGVTGSADFPTTVGAFDTTYNGGGDAFVTKVNSAGSALVYSTFLGGSEGEDGPFASVGGIAVDGGGNAYVTGSTESADFPTTVGAFDTTYNDRGDVFLIDVFVTKLNPAGSAPLIYSTYLGGLFGEHGNGIAVDSAGNAYVTGVTGSSDFPTTVDAFDTTFNGGSDPFVAKLSFGGEDTTTETVVHLEPGHTVVTTSPIPLGSTVHDDATVSSSSSGPTITGTVTYNFWTNRGCTGTPASSNTVSVGSESPSKGPLATGSYSFNATYSGDTNYNPSFSACEPFEVEKAATSIVTEVHNATHDVVTVVLQGTAVHDNATVSGQVDGFTITGTITYNFWTNSDCAELLAVETVGVGLESTPLTLAPGSYSYNATYSGDSNYEPSFSACEPLRVVAVVTIDIKPGSYPNSVNCKSQSGNVPVGIFTDDDFNAALVDISTLELEGYAVRDVDGKLHLEDLDDDGDLDAVVHLDKGDVCAATSDLPLGEDVLVVLTGSTTDALQFQGTDTIRIIRR